MQIIFSLVLLLPLLAAISGLFGRFLGRQGVIYMSCINLFLVTSFLIIINILILKNDQEIIFTYGSWMVFDLLSVNWTFRFTGLSSIMILMVSFISWIVHIYSCGYMYSDPALIRFMSYISLFTFFMFLLVLGDNFLILLVGWEGVGICSFLLIGFWHTRVLTSKAAFKALIFNKVGDAGLLIALGLIFCYIGSLDFNIVFSIISYLSTFPIFFIIKSWTFIDLISFFFTIGVMGKSAQLGLHAWLPDAMAGPTPVSALIHAATMVTAGVFLLIKCSFIFEYSNIILVWLICLGALTILSTTLVGLFQFDLKKIIAYSTCSQLGYMVLACGLSGYSLGFFHLFNHAFFKALLFLGAGVVIFSINGEQDIRKMGGLGKILPFTFCLMFISSLSLMGIPFLSGFYSKDLIIELACSSYYIVGLFGYFISQFCAILTAFYSTRLIYLVFLSKTNFIKNIFNNITEPFLYMQIPLFFLNLGGIFSGYLFNELFIGFGVYSFVSSIFTLPIHFNFDFEFLDFSLLWLGLLGVFSGTLFYIIFCQNLFLWFSIFTLWELGFIEWLSLWYFIRKKYLFDFIYLFINGYKLLIYSYYFFFKWIEKGVLEFIGPFYFSWIIYRLAIFNNIFLSGTIYNYIAFIIYFLFIFLFFTECIVFLI